MRWLSMSDTFSATTSEARNADDCNIYVRSERAGQRAMESISRFITQKLKLKVNEAKSAVARPQERKFLGFSFAAGPDIKRTIAPKSPERFKQRIRDITRRAKGVSITTTMDELAQYMRGWRGYFGFCETPEVLIALTRWVRLRFVEMPALAIGAGQRGDDEARIGLAFRPLRLGDGPAACGSSSCGSTRSAP